MRLRSALRPGAGAAGPGRRLRRRFAAAGLSSALLVPAACGGPWVESVGRPGTGDGEFRQPRGIAVSEHGLAVLDRTGRMQVFSTADRRWSRTIEVVGGDVRRGLPTGAAWLPDGSIVVAHTHVSRLVFFSPDGTVTHSFGEFGLKPGQFLYPQRVALDPHGDFIVSEYGISVGNRVQVVSPDGAPLRCFGGPDPKDGGLRRPMGAVIFSDGRAVVCDAGAGLVLFDAAGRPAGRFGPPPAERAISQAICRAGTEGDIYVADFGRHEVLRLSPDGTLIGVLGAPDGSGLPGPAPEGFREPWDVAWHAGRVYVADMGNHRIACIDPERAPWRLR